METNPNITRLLEMLDNPDAYSGKEILDIISKDDETREAYRIMVAAKQGYRNRESGEQCIDVDKAWERLETHPQLSPEGSSSHPKISHSWLKIAVSIIGVLFISAIAYAACIRLGIVGWQTQKALPQSEQANNKEAIRSRTITRVAPASKQESDTIKSGLMVYDNVPLEKMLSEIADYYGLEVIFENEQTRQLRFHFVWNCKEGIDKVIDNLNHFESLSVTLQDKQLIVE